MAAERQDGKRGPYGDDAGDLQRFLQRRWYLGRRWRDVGGLAHQRCDDGRTARRSDREGQRPDLYDGVAMHRPIDQRVEHENRRGEGSARSRELAAASSSFRETI